MSKIYKTDLLHQQEKIILERYVDFYESLLITTINNFIENSKDKLIGKAWDQQRFILENRLRIIRKVKNKCSVLAIAIENSKKTMENFMEEYDYIDDEKIEEISKQIDNCNILINSILARIFWQRTSPDYNESIDELESCLASTRIELEELRRKKEKMENLKTTDEAAYGEVSQSISAGYSRGYTEF